ncbi:MAG: GTPase [candidate division WOR-3 bacterium]
MPANLTPQYLEAEKRYRQAKTDEEKLSCLQEMLALIPKHKGTEKLQAEIKTKISKLKRSFGKKSGAKRTIWYHIDKQGAGQVVIFGAPNSGKSALVKALTNAPTEIADYPFTTQKPVAGMLEYEDIQIQLIDTPPITEDSEPWVFHIIRSGDLAVWVIDLADEQVLDTVKKTLELLLQARISPRPTTEMPYKKTIVVGSKYDEPKAETQLKSVQELLSDFNILPISVKRFINLEQLKRMLFQGLDIIRVYTKKPGEPPDLKEPVILKAGSSVIDAAYHLHKDFAKTLNYARLWDSNHYKGQRVERNHILKDKDIIEFHIDLK